jgi:hypothetical protein
MIRGRSGIMRCKAGTAGDSYNQDRLPGDVPSDRRLGRAGRHADIYLCPVPNEISLNHHRHIHLMDTSPGTEGSLGPRPRTLGLAMVRQDVQPSDGITEDGEARPQAATRLTIRGSPESTFGNGVGHVTPKRKT